MKVKPYARQSHSRFALYHTRSCDIDRAHTRSCDSVVVIYRTQPLHSSELLPAMYVCHCEYMSPTRH